MDLYKDKCDLNSVGGRIKYYRLRAGLLQADVAEKAGIDISTIKRYELNYCDHSLEICNKIAQAIGVKPELIYDDYLKFIASNYGFKIKCLRKKLLLSQAALGVLLGVHRKTIARLEKSKLLLTRKKFKLFKFYFS